jgi:hypothetical protein
MRRDASLGSLPERKDLNLARAAGAMIDIGKF